MNPNRFKEIDALRGIAALMVVVYHFMMIAPNNLSFEIGCSGVDLFFIISGFVIFLTLKKTTSWKDFVVSRFSRLYPAYWVCVTITTIAIIILTHYTGPIWDKNITLAKYLANMSMLQYYFKVHNIDGPYWTLVIELIFYFLMLLLFVTNQLKNIEFIGFALVLLLVPYHFNATKIDHSFIHVLIVAFPIICFVPLFFSGVIFYKMKFEKQTIFRYLTIILCLIVQLLLYTEYMNRNYITFFEYSIMLIIYYSSFVLYVNDFLFFIINKVSLFLGEISYSLYLIHQFIGTYIIIPFAIKFLHVNFWIASFGIGLPIVIILATVINRTIEKPCMNYIRSMYKSKIISAP